MKIQHQEHTIEEVIRYFVEGYNLEPGQRVASHESNYDPRTGKVWLKLVIEEPDLGKSES
jgi:hypothetical protein